MLIFAHTAIGATIGIATGNPVLSFPLGVASHHLADYVPHFDPGSYLLDQPREARGMEGLNKRDWLFIAIDITLSISLLIFLYFYLDSNLIIPVMFGILGAALPDLVHNVPFWSKSIVKINWIKNWQQRVHWQFHNTVPARLWYIGVITQLIPVIGLVWWVTQ